MRVDGMIYADETLMKSVKGDPCVAQVANVATLPGIVKRSLAMPDIHFGYGFCIGGVAATDPAGGGVISPGGVGYDINCGVRLIRSDLCRSDVEPRVRELTDALFTTIPCGVGRGGKVKLKGRQLDDVLARGAASVIDRGFGVPGDTEMTEDHGCLAGADPGCVSDRARQRGGDQCGTLGSGNHFIELQVVDAVFDKDAAAALGIEQGQITVMIHSGSRGLGHQVCDDAIRDLRDVPRKYGIELPDRQLVCAPVHSKEGQRYFKGMQAAANFAWANRQIMTHLARQALSAVLEQPWERIGLHLVYDVAHNIAKMESFPVGTVTKTLCIHRKGATRAYPPGHPDVPPKYRRIGQPVIIPGDMGRCSYVLVGQPGAMEHTFGSTCHGAGRLMSRHAAIRAAKGRSIHKELLSRGVYACARSRKGLDEEQPDAYKDVREVVSVVENAGISKIVCRLQPIGVIKG
ncbi:MAG: RtcB family protein [Phycisphaerales bacterium]|nr:MAG: RtcB family protein [Phycisphaerales bacterium]